MVLEVLSHKYFGTIDERSFSIYFVIVGAKIALSLRLFFGSERFYDPVNLSDPLQKFRLIPYYSTLSKTKIYLRSYYPTVFLFRTSGLDRDIFSATHNYG